MKQLLNSTRVSSQKGVSKDKIQSDQFKTTVSRLSSLLESNKPNLLELLFDFGSLYTRVAWVYKKPSKANNQVRKLVFIQPSCLLYESNSKQVLAIGKQAFKTIGKTPHGSQVLFPVHSGAIYDRRLFQLYLRALTIELKKNLPWRWLTQVKASCFIPQACTDLDKALLKQCFIEEGMSHIQVITKAEAILDDLAYSDDFSLSSNNNSGSFLAVLDIGDHLSELVIGSLGKVAVAKTLFFGSGRITKAIQEYLRREQGLQISLSQAMKIKHQLSNINYFIDKRSIIKDGDSIGTQFFNIRGIDLTEGMIVTKRIQTQNVGRVVLSQLPGLLQHIKRTLVKINSQQLLLALENGLLLTGGGSLLSGLDDYLSAELGLNVSVVSKPFSYWEE